MNSRAEARAARLRIRPKVIRLFGWLLLASTVFNALALIIYSPKFRADAVANHQAAAGWFAALVLLIALNSMLWRRIAIGAGNIARWLYIALVALSLLQFDRVYQLSLSYGWPYGALMGASGVLAVTTAGILLRQDAARWLQSGGQQGEIDPTVFR